MKRKSSRCRHNNKRAKQLENPEDLSNEKNVENKFDAQLNTFVKHLEKCAQISIHSISPIKKQKDKRCSSYSKKSIKLDKDLQNAKEKLCLSYVPDCLHGREEEYRQIKEYVTYSIDNGGNLSALYISGMPGTGKTASVERVLSDLPTSYQNKVKIIRVNGMELINCHQIYSLIHQQLFPSSKAIAPSTALRNLTKYFIAQKAPKSYKSIDIVKLLILDEMDAVIMKKQNILYNIFEWLSNPKSQLVIIGIANIMNLPEILDKKLTSRIGKERIVFKPYTSTQIKDIVYSRLTSSHVFESEAIKYISMKIASVSSDIRRTLFLCNRSIDIALENSEQTVLLEHALKVEANIRCSQNCKIINSLSPPLQLCIYALIIERSHSESLCTVDRIYSRYLLLHHTQEITQLMLSLSDYVHALDKLCKAGIINLQSYIVRAPTLYNDEVIYSIKDSGLRDKIGAMIEESFGKTKKV